MSGSASSTPAQGRPTRPASGLMGRQWLRQGHPQQKQHLQNSRRNIQRFPGIIIKQWLQNLPCLPAWCLQALLQCHDSGAPRPDPGKKWFLAPSLKAEAGKAIVKTTGWDYTEYSTVHSLPPLKLRYDTAENLKLRNILKPSIPAHAAILRSSSNERVAALLPAGDAAGSSRRQQAVAKREGRGVKRERQQQQQGGDADVIPQSATAETINLVDEAAPCGPLLVCGRPLAADELAVCDLCCDSDGEEPAWQVTKKPAIEVTADA